MVRFTELPGWPGAVVLVLETQSSACAYVRSMLNCPSILAVGVPAGMRNSGAVGPTVALHGFTGAPSRVALQEIFWFVPSSTTPVIVMVIFLPSVTEVSTPSQMMPTRSVSMPLWKSVTLVRPAATPPVLWQVWQSVVSFMLLWKVDPEAAKSSAQLSIDPWQLKQPAPVTGIALAAARVDGVSWQTLQFVM